MKFDVIGGGALPELEIRLVHSEKKARKAIRRLEGREYEEDWKSLVGRQATTSFLRVPGSEETIYLVWMTPCTDYDAAVDASLLAHEAVHVARHYLKSFGEESPGEELLAYVVQDISLYLIERHFKWKKKRISKQ